MYVIIGLSVLAVVLAVFFLFTLRASVLYPRPFLREVGDAAQRGDLEAVVSLCGENDSAAAAIIGGAMEQMKGADQVDYLLIRDAIEDEGGMVAGACFQRVQYLLDIAVIAPMVGLLGTVLGMLQSFSGLQAELGAVKQTVLAQGVAKALITTAGGLLVGIAAMVLYALFRGRVSKLVAGLENACARVLRSIVGNHAGRRA
jgi:biopolymer transport protein ExbB